MGTSYAIELLKKDIEYYKRYDKFYFLKLDISKYFYKIDHEVLIKLIERDLNEEELKLIKKILNSTNYSYVNKVIESYENKLNIELPRYEYNKGLPIGNMTSQFLAILYLSKLQHYIRHNLKLRFVNYMDDYIIIHEDREYLKKCLKIIEDKLNKEYKLEINKKKTIIKLSSSTRRNIKKGIKRSKYLYENKLIKFNQLFSSIENYKYSYKHVDRIYIENIFNMYWY